MDYKGAIRETDIRHGTSTRGISVTWEKKDVRRGFAEKGHKRMWRSLSTGKSIKGNDINTEQKHNA